MLITGLVVSGSISVLCASANPNTFLANSITAICIPRQIPKKGRPFSLAYFTAVILPSIPRCPKPGATNRPSRPSNFSDTFSSFINSLCTFTTCTLHSFTAPACIKLSNIDLYASCSSIYFPINPIVTLLLGYFNLSRKTFHFAKSGSL